jgi:hypothetical protein
MSWLIEQDATGSERLDSLAEFQIAVIKHAMKCMYSRAITAQANQTLALTYLHNSSQGQESCVFNMLDPSARKRTRCKHYSLFYV